MKAGILKDLYNGKLNPFENAVSKEDGYREVSRTILEDRKKLIEHLPEKEREQFEKWDEKVLDAGSMDGYAKFACGFRLGVLLMCEIMLAEEETAS